MNKFSKKETEILDRIDVLLHKLDKIGISKRQVFEYVAKKKKGGIPYSVFA